MSDNIIVNFTKPAPIGFDIQQDGDIDLSFKEADRVNINFQKEEYNFNLNSKLYISSDSFKFIDLPDGTHEAITANDRLKFIGDGIEIQKDDEGGENVVKFIGGGGDVSFDGAITSPAGEFTGNSMQDFVNLFFQSVNPSVSVSVSPSNSLKEYGNNVINPTVTTNITQGSNPVADMTSITFYRDSTEIHTGTDTSFQDTNTVSNRTVYKAVIEDTQGRTANSSRTYSFVYPFFYGVASGTAITDGITETALNDLSGVVKSISYKGNKTVSASPNSERFVILYPASYGNLSSIIDDNGFETISDYNASTITITSMLDGTNQSYKFYQLKSDTTQDGFTNQYKF